jgi:hypothetical protein
MYVDRAEPLSRVCDARGHTPHLDHALSWHLATVRAWRVFALHAAVEVNTRCVLRQVLTALGYTPHAHIDVLTDSFVSELEASGLWQWALYVRLCTPVADDVTGTSRTYTRRCAVVLDDVCA